MAERREPRLELPFFVAERRKRRAAAIHQQVVSSKEKEQLKAAFSVAMYVRSGPGTAPKRCVPIDYASGLLSWQRAVGEWI